MLTRSIRAVRSAIAIRPLAPATYPTMEHGFGAPALGPTRIIDHISRSVRDMGTGLACLVALLAQYHFGGDMLARVLGFTERTHGESWWLKLKEAFLRRWDGVSGDVVEKSPLGVDSPAFIDSFVKLKRRAGAVLM
ncbi:MAG: hypothetical protein M1840_005850 [Geoglossum simile]|nr:MAG: hypothetical protein M1840_005850 [Geoglossum simile]